MTGMMTATVQSRTGNAAAAEGARHWGRRCLSAALLLGAVTSASLQAASVPGAPLGGEFRVNTYTSNRQWTPSISSDAQGKFVVTWASYLQDGSSDGIYAQRYAADGMPQGSEFRVNTTTDNVQTSPSIASDAQGNFVVTWQSSGQDAPNTYGIYAQRYAADGTPRGGEFRVNTYTVGDQSFPAIASDALGNFVVTWASNAYGQQDGSDYGVYAQRYAADGTPRGGEFRVNTYTYGRQWTPSIASDAQGNFVVSWISDGQDGSEYGVYAQRYGADGALRGGEFRVNTSTTYSQIDSSIASDAQGNFVVTWTSYLQDGFPVIIQAQRYAADGTPQGEEFRVDTATNGAAYHPSIASDAQGGFVVAYYDEGSNESGDSAGVYAQRYATDGTLRGSRFQLGPDYSSSPSISSDAQGNFIVAWAFYVHVDDDTYNVYAQRFAGAEDVDLALVKTADKATASPGDMLTYTLDVTNNHAVVAHTGFPTIDQAIGIATGVQLTDPLPPEVTFLGASGADWTCAEEGGILTCDHTGALLPSTSSGIDVTVQLPAEFTGISNTAYVDANQYDSTQANNEDAAETAFADDPTPNAFSFQGQTGIARSKLVSSNGVTLHGFNAVLPISVSGAEYRIFINSVPGPWTTAPSTVQVNNKVQLRMKASSKFSTAVTATLTVGGVSGSFTVTTASDDLPNPFSFIDQIGVARSKLVSSNGVTLHGFDVPLPISISGGGEYRIFVGSVAGPWTSASGTVEVNNKVQLRMKASSSSNTAVTSTLTVGSVAGTFTVTTAPDDVPDSFNFVDQSDVPIGRTITSNGVTLHGFDIPLPISISGGKYRLYIDGVGGPWTAAPGTIAAGNKLQLRLTSAPTSGTAVSITVTVGTISATFTAVTATAFAAAGGEFRVNTYTDSYQEMPSIASDAQGNFVVTWMSEGKDGPGYGNGIYAQRYAVDGTPLGGEFRVNTYVISEQIYPSIASDAQGNFIVTWMSHEQDGSGYGIYAQRYAADGTPQGGEFRVNTYTTDSQFYPAIASDAQGNFVVTWASYAYGQQDGSDYGVYAQRYAADGTPQGGEFRVNTYTIDSQYYPAIASDAQGHFVVTWMSYEQDGSGMGIYAQRYAADGTPQGGEFRVNTYTTDSQYYPAIASDAQGHFVVTWMSHEQDGSGYGIYAQRYAVDGTPLGGEFRVNTYVISEQIYPSIASDAQGNFIVTWMSYEQDGSGYGIYAQRYAADGTPQGGEFRVNTYVGSYQIYPAIASDAQGHFVVTWMSNAQDGSGYGIYAQRYTGP